MIPDTYRPVFSLLQERTASGDVLWKPTPDEDTFAVYLKEFSVMVRAYTQQVYNEPPEAVVRFEVVNEDGEEIDSFQVAENEPAFEAAIELHASARRKAMRIDDAVDAILQELKGEGPVGEDQAPSTRFAVDEDDDLPF